MIPQKPFTNDLLNYGLAICIGIATATGISIGVGTGKQLAPDFVSKFLRVEKNINGN